MTLREKVNLDNLSEENLLNLRIKDLPLKIEGTWLSDCVKELYQELQAKGIKFRPVCYLGDEWFSPDEDPQIGVPFYLAHPSLAKIEKKMMLEAEGETKSWCMQLLRHEAGHAINYAYKLYHSPDWKKIFGQFSKAYVDTYRFRPYSKSFVRHLEKYYAQCHPDEDFAETFAIWLTPGINWQAQYKGWKALQKLLYVDKIIQEIKEKPALVKNGKKYRKASSLSITLANYYKKKKHIYAENFPDFHDSNLLQIFSNKSSASEAKTLASSLIKKYKKNISEDVSIWTGEKKFIINNLLETLIGRCKYLNLVNLLPEPQALLKVSVYVTALITNYVNTASFSTKKWIKN